MKDFRVFLWLVVFVMLGYLFFSLRSVITPFLLAALLAYLGNPIVERLEALCISRSLSVTIVFAGILLLILLIIVVLIPLIGAQIERLMSHLPEYGAWFKETVLPRISKIFNIAEGDLNVENLVDAIRAHLGDSSRILQTIAAKITGSAHYLVSFFTYLFLIPVITFYLLRDWDLLLDKICELIPRAYFPTISNLAVRSDEVLGGFLRGQMIVMLCLGIIYSIGLTVLGLDLAIVIGMFAGLVSFVPYLGLIIGIFFAGLMALIQFQDIAHPVGVMVVFLFAQSIEGTVLTPHFVGDRIGLHPAAVLFSILAGGHLFGFLGVLLALPAAAVINVFLGHIKEHYLQSDTYLETDENGRKLPAERYINF